MKTIIHNKIETPIRFSPDSVNGIHQNLKRWLGDEYIVVTTPTDLSVIDGDSKIIKIDCKEYSYNELIESIEKAEELEAQNVNRI